MSSPCMLNVTYRIYQIDKAFVLCSSFLCFMLSCALLCFYGIAKIFNSSVFPSMKNKITYRKETEEDKKGDVWKRKKYVLNRICLIKSIVILINSTENCHRYYCHDLRFLLLWDWNSGTTFFWHFYMRFSHIVSVTYWNCVCVWVVCVFFPYFQNSMFAFTCHHFSFLVVFLFSFSLKYIYTVRCVRLCIRGYVGYMHALEHSAARYSYLLWVCKLCRSTR